MKKGSGWRAGSKGGSKKPYRLCDWQGARLQRLRGRRGHSRPIQPSHASLVRRLLGPAALHPRLRLRPEANSACALGPGATVGVLGTRVPRLTSLRAAMRSYYGLVWPS